MYLHVNCSQLMESYLQNLAKQVFKWKICFYDTGLCLMLLFSLQGIWKWLDMNKHLKTSLWKSVLWRVLRIICQKIKFPIYKGWELLLLSVSLGRTTECMVSGNLFEAWRRMYWGQADQSLKGSREYVWLDNLLSETCHSWGAPYQRSLILKNSL